MLMKQESILKKDGKNLKVLKGDIILYAFLLRCIVFHFFATVD